MSQTKKWTVKDVITTVLLSVLLILIQLVVNMVCMVNDFVSMVLSVGFTMLLCAPIYFLMVGRVRQRGVSFVYMTILGIVFLIMGNWYLLPYYMVVGVICEAVLWENGWESKKKMTAAWTIASVLYNGVNLLPLWFFWDTYEKFALSSGMAKVGKGVSYSEAKAGDLILYPHHVGIYIGGGKIVHASGSKKGICVTNAKNCGPIQTVRRIVE